MIANAYLGDGSWEINDDLDDAYPRYPVIWCDMTMEGYDQAICGDVTTEDIPLPANWHFCVFNLGTE